MVTKLQLIGGGRMGQALAGGLIDAGWADAGELAVAEIDVAQREHLAHLYPAVLIIDRPMPGVDAVLAVKPHLVEEVCRSLTDPRRIISIAAGVTIAAIEAALPAGAVVIRVMPNTPALVRAGAAGLAGGAHASADDIAWATAILGAVGEAVVVTESQLDAVTGLSGSGPAYVFLLAEAMTDAGVAAGLDRGVAARLATQTIYGAGKMMVETGTSPTELRAQVTTPAGTTAAGLAAFEDHGFRAAVGAAVRAATDRSIELGRAG